MGYYTRYQLTTEPNTFDVKTNIRDFEIGDYPVSSLIDGSLDCKWYDHVSDMMSISERFPDILFCLEGRGEEFGDVWRKYFKHGKVQVCRGLMTIHYDPYDETKLKTMDERFNKHAE